MSGDPPPSVHSKEFGLVADAYHRARPSYPGALLDDVLRLCERPRPRVLEVGAGTGQATELFAQRNLDIVALEPSAEMAALARKRCAAYPTVSFVVSSFESWPGEQGGFGLVMSAQAWHWVPPEVRYKKAHRVLGSGGSLALFWSRPLWEDCPLGDQLAALYKVRAPQLHGCGPWFPGFVPADAGRDPGGAFIPGGWLEPGQEMEIQESGLFDSISYGSYAWRRDHPVDEVIDLLRTLPEHASLPPSAQEGLFDVIGHQINRAGGRLMLGYRTQMFFARRVT